jgi:hypothetical protein
VPTAIKSLAARLGDGNAEAWGAALRVFELSYSRPAETAEVAMTDIEPMGVAGMTPADRAVVIR